ncbi:MAG: DUF1579 domain-containing protein [Myxococcota bacterium]
MDLPPMNPGPEHDRLATFVGDWSGPVSTWFDPDGAPEESAWRLSGALVLGGRFVRLTYSGTAMGKPHAGEILLGYERDEKRYTAAWIDSFHSGTQIMVSHGQAEGDGISVLGSYPAGDERWGWRTRFRRDGDSLVIAMTNLGPSGPEDRAVEAVLTRA